MRSKYTPNTPDKADAEKDRLSLGETPGSQTTIRRGSSGDKFADSEDGLKKAKRT